MHNLISSYLVIVVITAAVAAYMLPTFVAWSRRAPGLMVTAIVNLFLGWTLIGWLAAFAMALRRPPPIIQVINQITMPDAPPVPDKTWQ